ncbi:leucine--tRNA ligase [Striga asiatica]|uniref:Leucine--tRNA ligase n=1 Tax=Striga asiatica TaxID=4170 RepID=A0A5A7R7P5_STRAF|nr:leucine--tRNA ligase [Striga asiatica]
MKRRNVKTMRVANEIGDRVQPKKPQAQHSLQESLHNVRIIIPILPRIVHVMAHRVRGRYSSRQSEAPLELSLHILRVTIIQAQELVRVTTIISVTAITRIAVQARRPVRIEQELGLIGPARESAKEGKPIGPLDVVFMVGHHVGLHWAGLG